MFDPLLILGLVGKLVEALARQHQGTDTEADRQLLKQSEMLARTDLANATGHSADLDHGDIGGNG